MAITSAPLYYDGIVYSGNTGGEYGVRGRLTALDAKTGKILWRFYTLPGPGEVGGDTWPAGNDHTMRMAAPRSGTRRRSIRSSGSSTSRPAIAGPIMTGRCAKATICSAPRSSRLTPRPANMFGTSRRCTTTSGTMMRRARSRCSTPSSTASRARGSPQAGRTGWVYILDRTNGKPLIGIEERPVPQEPLQQRRKRSPIRSATRSCRNVPSRWRVTRRAGCIFEAFWEEPTLIQPSGHGGTNWSPMSYNPDTGYLYVPGTIRTSAFSRYGDTYKKGQRYNGRHPGGHRSARL